MAKQSIKELYTLTRVVRGTPYSGMCFYLLSTLFCIISFGIPNAYAEPVQNPGSVQNKPPISNDELAKRALEIARQEAKVNKVLKDEDNNPRRIFTSSATKEVRYKRYIGDCITKIERLVVITSTPAEGVAQLAFTIKRDGGVEDVHVTQSSGLPILDSTAIHLIQTAAPYPPFPPEIAKDADTITIVHTFKMTMTNR